MLKKAKKIYIFTARWLHISDHLFNEKAHTGIHRRCYGLVVMAMGVGLAKGFASHHELHFLADMVGYGVHGVGAAPFIELLISKYK
jgi:hypothetical protein